jgi:hypothetical protein
MPGRALLDHPVKPDDDKKEVVWTGTLKQWFWDKPFNELLI